MSNAPERPVEEWGPPPLLAPPDVLSVHPAYGPPPPRPVDGFAILTLVFGIVPLPVLAFVFGVLALLRIRRTGDGGREMTVVGLVLAAVWTLVLAVVIPLVGYAVLAPAAASPEVAATPAGASAGLRPGDCVDDVAATDLADMTVVACAQAHNGQVVASFELPGGTFRGEDATSADAEEGCRTRMGPSVTDRVDGGELTYYFLYPSQESWATGDRAVDCLIARDDLGPLTEDFAQP